MPRVQKPLARASLGCSGAVCSGIRHSTPCVNSCHPSETALFDVTIAVELQQMHAKDLSTTVERLTSLMGPKLAGDRASFHTNVKPAADKLDPQRLALLPRTRKPHSALLPSVQRK
jgi:hypothetical protein